MRSLLCKLFGHRPAIVEVKLGWGYPGPQPTQCIRCGGEGIWKFIKEDNETSYRLFWDQKEEE